MGEEGGLGVGATSSPAFWRERQPRSSGWGPMVLLLLSQDWLGVGWAWGLVSGLP